MKIAVGCDPNAKSMKMEILEEIAAMGHEAADFGSDDPVYANVVIEVAESVVRGESERGIVLCGTGIGASIAANKVAGAYCALVTDTYQAERAALSNNANLIAMGQQVTGSVIARRITRTWLTHTFDFDPQGRSGPKVRRIVDYAEDHRR